MEVNCCPGCLSTGYEVKGGKGKSFDTAVGGETFWQPEYFIKCCVSCGLYYKSHTLNPTELNQYYEVVDFSKWEIDGLFPSEQSLVALLSALPKGSNILDYGCSSGRLLSNLVDSYRCFGVEVNQKAANIAESKGITILSEQRLEASPTFDAIVLCDVFEHLPNPTSLLRALKSKLKRGGLLVLCTGNADASVCQKDIANFWYFRTPEHLCMLSKKFAHFLASSLGLELLVWEEVTHYDLGLLERVRQRVKDFLFWQFHREELSFWATVLSLMPLLNRAKNWDTPPAVTCTNDHVLAVLGNTSECGSSH